MLEHPRDIANVVSIARKLMIINHYDLQTNRWKGKDGITAIIELILSNS